MQWIFSPQRRETELQYLNKSLQCGKVLGTYTTKKSADSGRVCKRHSNAALFRYCPRERYLIDVRAPIHFQPNEDTLPC